MPLFNSGVTTMKMMRSTRQTSTSGVTLMSLWSLSRPPPPPIAIGLRPPKRLGGANSCCAAPLDEVVEQLRGRVGHLDLEALDLVHEDVEKPDRRDRDEETEGRRDEGLRDPAGDRADSGRARRGHAPECVDDPDDRSKEADEGS